MNLKDLRKPFAPEDIEWRVQQSGKGSKGPWAIVLAYVTNRAIMDRLDEVCGPENWQNEFATGPQGGVICCISIKVNGEWVRKWDGAENTQVEEVKGGLSSSMKRAGVQWGIGRYLYDLEATFAKIHDKGANRAKLKDGTEYRWDPPDLPPWAKPKAETQKPKEQPAPQQQQVEVTPVSMLEGVKDELSRIDSLPHLENHWKKHGVSYHGDPKHADIVGAYAARKAEIVADLQAKSAA